ncbi:hypothetical protein E2C01_041809 [Portunus trituberculatus]|uniref:Uncharacterized protein n=1 Tax=Portunus trituberculatus TaxID=210409 RepID=A0A5B7FRN4_PORTR|nr:hypothetical protein [Portunus trituberculatus]
MQCRFLVFHIAYSEISCIVPVRKFYVVNCVCNLLIFIYSR